MVIEQKQFGRLRSFIWPVHKKEYKKLLPMLALFFLITFIYNLLRPTKISLMVMAEGSGAEVIPYLKVWAVLPGAFIFTYLFTKLINQYSREKTFFIMVGIFIAYFALFMCVLYPNRAILELKTLSTFLHNYLPHGFKGLISVIRHWNLSVFYVMAELWATIVLCMLFWGFANEITGIDEAKRFYGIFVLVSNISGIFCGIVGKHLSFKTYIPALPFGQDPWEQSVYLVLGLTLLLGIAVLGIFYYLNNLMKKQQNRMSISSKTHKKTKTPLSMKECFKYLLESRYLMYITLMVVAYNIVYNLSEVLWTHQVKENFSNASDFNAYMNNITSITGVISTFLALFVCGNVIRKFGWTVTALISPVIWIITSTGLFAFLFLEKIDLSGIAYGFLSAPFNVLALVFASAQITLGRASKYTVFDETKEIAFVPLSKENQRKGKAVVDGIAGWIGRSGGAIIYQVLLVFLADIAATIPYVATMFFIMIGIWIYSVKALGKMVKQSIDNELITQIGPDLNTDTDT
ncbi:MAG: tlcA-C [Francisellaceae bacterium]|nr:tlcA-C [Francisellaceae bacterium]